MDILSQFLKNLSNRKDLFLVGLLMTTIAVMIIPLPPGLLDVLIALNISLTLLILIVSIYLEQPTSFSTFPAVILIATTFRLALSISTTRSVLISADGGEIVRTFGVFVTGGNIAVGLVIFLIITVVQFLVITKGAERVAEVSARFTLDALPGRQMSIDAEMRAGDIDAGEARRRRRLLDKENQFFGAMDGAMKFVKGDAIAGLLIVAINLIGGIGIGVVQKGMGLAEAGKTYSLLTVGDGLVAQIPALLIALCAGAVITRVTSEQKGDLGSNIMAEIIADPKVLTVTGAVVLCLGFVPGFPSIVFAVFAAGLGGMGYLLRHRALTLVAEHKTQAAVALEDHFKPSGDDRLSVRVGMDVAYRLDVAAFAVQRRAMLRQMEATFGFKLPSFGFIPDDSLAPDSFSVMIDGVSIFQASMPGDAILARTDADTLRLAGIDNNVADDALGAVWIDDRARFVDNAAIPQLESAKVPYMDQQTVIIEVVQHIVKRQLAAFVGFDTLQALSATVHADNPDLVEQVLQNVPRARILDVMRRLVAEQAPLTPPRRLFEALAEAGQKESDPALLTEMTRYWLRNQICNIFAGDNRVITGYIIEPELEDALRSTLKQSESGPVLILSAAASNMVLAQIDQIPRQIDRDAPPPVIVASGDLRRHFRNYLLAHNIDRPILGFQEIGQDFKLHPIGTLALQRFDAPANAA